MKAPIYTAALILLSIPLLTTARVVITCNGATSAPAPLTSPTAAPSQIDESKFIDALKAICPKSAKEPCIDDVKTKGQCRTAAKAAGPILRSFERYGIVDKNEMAALISLMALESVEFKYQRNVYPGRPGQGTRNMQMPEYNALYATSIPELKAQTQTANGDKTKILDLLLSQDDYDFGSAAWFLTSHCSRDVRRGLQAGTQAGWKKYITGCVNATVSEERLQYWQIAMKEMREV